jgi:hypothetical protein
MNSSLMSKGVNAKRQSAPLPREQACHCFLGIRRGGRSPRFSLRCFHCGAFFEDQEHWESVWLMVEEPEKTFVQGLIQVAAAFHHFQRGNCAGAISLLRSALRRLDGYAPAFAGIAVEPLCTTVLLWLEALGTVSQSPPPPLPQLQLAERGVTSLRARFSVAAVHGGCSRTLTSLRGARTSSNRGSRDSETVVGVF